MTKNHAALLRLSARIGRADAAAGLGFCELTFRESLRSEVEFDGLRLPPNPGRWTECVSAYRSAFETCSLGFSETIRRDVILYAEASARSVVDDERSVRSLCDESWSRLLLRNGLGATLARLTDADRDSAQSLHRQTFRVSL